MNVFQSLDRQSFVETFIVMLVVEKGHLNEVSQFSLVVKRVVALIVPVVCRRKLKKFHLSIHITTFQLTFSVPGISYRSMSDIRQDIDVCWKSTGDEKTQP
jgi:hypothetical protein